MAEMTPGLEAAIRAGHIDRIAQVVRDYFAAEAPDIAAQLFNQDAEEIAMRIWPIAEKAVLEAAAAIPDGGPRCDRCEKLRADVAFWRDQQKFAASVAANVADLNDYDGRLAALRSLLAKETERRRRAEDQVAALTYQLQVATGTQA